MAEITLGLLSQANIDPAIRGRVKLTDESGAPVRRDALLSEGEVVGFVTPHETKWGWRHGPIFVLPDHRQKGLVLAYYNEHPDRVCVAFVADSNASSRVVHERAGFVNWRRGNGGWFMRRDALDTMVLAIEDDGRTEFTVRALAAIYDRAMLREELSYVETKALDIRWPTWRATRKAVLKEKGKRA